MNTKQGSLSISSENIFPVIKKWLYSDHDIFLRELISNGCDAITKLKKLEMMGEAELPLDYKAKINVTVNPEAKTLVVEDNGLGMTADEVDEYINQIAFSGATDFLEKYKDKASEDQIIGHFGLGFYSAFMVADTVEIDTLSWQPEAAPVHWSCDGGTDYEMGDGTKEGIGTRITLHLNEDCLEFANEYRVREIIEKYCAFMPVEIFLDKANAPEAFETIDAEDRLDTDVVVEEIHEEAKFEEKENENGEKEMVEVTPAKERLKIRKRPVALNDIHPLWAKTPADCTEEEYKAFYRKVFMDYKEPLFWIHLNMDYPFRLKGILYFPKINMEYDAIEGTIKLYNNQVFIADNIKEVIPEYLMLLKGVIDCPDLPLNVSRSALQNDGFVTKISEYISKKVADKLSGMCKTDKENYEKYWDDISPFIKYGCLRDTKFCDRMNDYILFKDIDGKYTTLPELLKKEDEKKEDAAAEGTGNADKPDAQVTDADETTVSDGAESGETAASNASETGAEEAEVVNADGTSAEADAEPADKRRPVYYVTDEKQQGQYINLFREQGLNAVILDHNIDSSFITQLEQRNENYRFLRIDADLNDTMVETDDADGDLSGETETLSGVFKEALNKDGLQVKAARIKNHDVAGLLTQDEDGRRMQDMMRMYGMGDMGGMYAGGETLILNVNHPLVQYILEHKDGEMVPDFCSHLYDLATLANHPLAPEAMTAFIARSNKLMLALAK